MKHVMKDGSGVSTEQDKYADSDHDDASSLGGGEDGLDSGSAHTDSNIRDDIAGKFSNLVTRSGSAVSLMLFLTATLVVSSTYVFLTRTKVAEFEKAVSSQRHAAFINCPNGRLSHFAPLLVLMI